MNPQQQANQWAENSYFDGNTRKAAQAALKDEAAVFAAFGSELNFGTGGLRGIVGVGTAKMNRYTVGRATLGLARYLKAKSAHPSVALAHDSRHGSREFTRVAAEILVAEGIHVHVFKSLTPTPILSYAVRSLCCDAGIMVTASHNPAEYNGYKVYGADGCQVTDQAAWAITQEMERVGYTDAVQTRESKARESGLWLDVTEAVLKGFERACLLCRPDASVCEELRVAYTPLHGAGLLPVREVLRRMQGLTVVEAREQCEPDGDFPTCPRPNPELDEALAVGLAVAKRENAELLLATDPDCDRVGVAARAPDGGYRRLSGNEVGLLLCDYVFDVKKARGVLPKRPVLVKTIVTSDLAFSIARRYGAEVVEVLTGFKYIGEVIGALEKAGEEERFVFGFEESCGYLAGTHVRDKDGVMACMLVCEMAQAYKARGLSLLDQLERLYAEHGYMATALLNFDLAGASAMREMEALMKRLRLNPPQSLAGKRLIALKDYAPGLNGLPPSNVLSFEADGVKAIVRPSGTEPKAKLYLSARGASRAEAEDLMERMRTDAKEWMLLP